MPVVLAVIVIAQLMLGIDATVVVVAMPTIGAELGLDVVDQSWIQTAYVVAFGGLLLLGGRLGDVLGRRRALVGGILLFTAASALGGLADAGPWLVAARALQGAGAAVIGPNAMALLMLSFPTGPARDRALSIMSAVLSSGAVVGLVVGGVLTSSASWRWGLLINLPIGLAVALLAPRVLPETPRTSGALDLPGVATSALGLGALVFGLTRAAEHGWTAPDAVGGLVAAVVLLAAFAVIEQRAARPVLPPELLRDRGRSAGYLASMLAAAAMFGTFFLLTQFLQEVLGFDALAAGLGFLALMLPQLVTVRLVPRLLARWRPRVLVPTGAALAGAAALWLSRLDASSTYAGGLVGPMLLIGIGGGLVFVPLTRTILAAVPPEQAGAASGTLQVTQYTGTALGVAVLVGVYAAAGRAGLALPSALATGMLAAAAFVVAVAVLARAADSARITSEPGATGSAPTSPSRSSRRPWPRRGGRRRSPGTARGRAAAPTAPRSPATGPHGR
ncbi:MFS transporter [Pseudonocardia sp. CA-107938]|uniref:MFS transporter n=1 Tax=Pseudonocardia sp. CA-107938 TaxID=3240021 RepID=UPI003D8B69B2